MEPPDQGLSKAERIDLGLALLSRAARRGVELSQEDLAAWCDCSFQTIGAIEAKALKKLRSRLALSGLDIAELLPGCDRGATVPPRGHGAMVD
jgi:DNA-binding XRE family transcriptional regulator